jgi:hypothetical protein
MRSRYPATPLNSAGGAGTVSDSVRSRGRDRTVREPRRNPVRRQFSPRLITQHPNTFTQQVDVVSLEHLALLMDEI